MTGDVAAAGVAGSSVMHERRPWRWAALAMSLVACGRVDRIVDVLDAGVEPSGCVPGRTAACACAGGATGVQTCAADGTFGACQCGSTGGGGGTATGGGAGGGGGGDAGFVFPGTGGVVITSGTDTLVDLFPVRGGLLVVRSTGVDRLDLQGATVRTVVSPREITAAAFDGTLLGVADRALLTVYDADLDVQRTVNLVESCASAVMISGARFVCGPANDWDRLFSVFDLDAGTLLRRGPEKFTYHGIPMRRVPGTDDFVTVTTALSPSDFFLSRVPEDLDAGVQFFGDSPYHGDFPVSTSFAFDDTPAQHLVTQQGLLLRIYTPTCAPNGSCFSQDGTLGVLPNGKQYVTMTEGPSGTLYGIVEATAPASGFDPKCRSGCDVQRVDVAARVVRAATRWSGSIERVVAFRLDPYQPRLVLGFLTPGTTSGTSGGWQIVTFPP